MAKKVNARCPLQVECERKCAHEGHELDCDYYSNNARAELVIEDQEAIRQQREQEAEDRMYEELYGSDLDEDDPSEESAEVPEEEHIAGNGKMVMLPIEQLHPHPDNPRRELGDLTELADSIRAKGVFQNLTVVPFEDGYRIIIGHRRRAAAELAGLAQLPCVIVEMTPKEQVETMLLENMQREDLTVYEQAQGFQMMLDLGSTVEEIAEKSGFSEKTVRRRVKMMELDQKKLKEVSARQLSLGDFDTLAQIEDIKERNKVLDSIGTNDFNANVRSALRKQKEKHNLPLIKAWLKEVGAKELKQNEAYGNKYESYDGRYSISVSEWGEKGNCPPKVGKLPVFYILEKWGGLRLYKKREKAKPEKKPPEQLAKEKAIREAWAKLEQVGSLAYDLRKQFVQKLTVTAKNRPTLLYGALSSHLLECINYNSPDRDSICAVFDIKTDCYDSKRGEKLADGLRKITDEVLPGLIYAGFGDGKKELCTSNFRDEFPEFKRNVKLDVLYEWLQLLGYEPSTEELQMRSGTHEAYYAKESYDAVKQGRSRRGGDGVWVN